MQDIFNLKNGACVLMWPENIDREDLDFMVEFLELEIKQIKSVLEKKVKTVERKL